MADNIKNLYESLLDQAETVLLVPASMYKKYRYIYSRKTKTMYINTEASTDTLYIIE